MKKRHQENYHKSEPSSESFSYQNNSNSASVTYPGSHKRIAQKNKINLLKVPSQYPDLNSIELLQQHGGMVVRTLSQQGSPEFSSTIWLGSFCVEFKCSLGFHPQSKDTQLVELRVILSCLQVYVSMVVSLSMLALQQIGDLMNKKRRVDGYFSMTLNRVFMLVLPAV